MKVLIIDNGTIHLKRLRELLSKNEVKVVPLFSDYSDAKKYDLVVLSGGSNYTIVKTPGVFKNEMLIVKSLNKPIVGICEGCELIAYTYGSDLEELQVKQKGIKEVNFLENSYFGSNFCVEVYEAHQWVIKKLGPELSGIAKSHHGWEVIKHKTKPTFGLQFHPEMLPDDTMGNQIFNKIVGLITR